MRNTMMLLTLVLTCAGLVSCNSSAKVTDKNVHIIDDSELAEMMDSGKPILLIDARPNERYHVGHLPGAINIPLPDLDKDDARFAKTNSIVVYGEGSESSLSNAAAKKLLVNPKLTVWDFRGGLEMWKHAGRDVVTDD